MTASDYRQAASPPTASPPGDRQPTASDTASPTARTASGFGWSDRQDRQRGDRQRHAGIGDRAEIERSAAEDDLTDDDPDDATHRMVVAKQGSGALAIVTDDEHRQRYPLVDTPRFVDEDVNLRQLLLTARRGDYALCHIRGVRAANTAHSWWASVAVTVVFALVWAFGTSFHRCLTIAAILLAAAQAVPVVPWLVIQHWTPTTWSWLGGIVLAFGVTTAVAAAVEKRREPQQ
jgi:hypothetical protein